MKLQLDLEEQHCVAIDSSRVVVFFLLWAEGVLQSCKAFSFMCFFRVDLRVCGRWSAGEKRWVCGVDMQDLSLQPSSVLFCCFVVFCGSCLSILICWRSRPATIELVLVVAWLISRSA